MSEQNRLEINWFNALGGALGAVSAAVVLSTLGTAGTLIGAAIGSLCITIGGAIYAHSMRVAHERLLARRAMLARGAVPAGGAQEGSSAAETLDTSEDVGRPASESRLQLLRALPWKRILAASAALFVIAMAVIVVFELSTGRPVSSFTGGTSDTDSGTSVPGLGGGESGPVDEPPAEDAPDEAPTGGEDSEQPSAVPEEQASVPPTDDQGPAPAEENTVEPSPTALPSEPQSTTP